MKNSITILLFLLAVPVPCNAQEDLGKLFYTAEQRQALDAGKRVVVKSAKGEPAPRAKPKTEDLALRGVVTRSDGERTVWINDKTYHNDSPKGVGVKIRSGNPATAEISLGASQKSVPVKVGEQLDGETGMVRQYKAREAQENAMQASGNAQHSTTVKKESQDPKRTPSAESGSPAATPQ
ncbi:MAG: hypothetical protein ABL878_05900 [Burkholderiales bacterium]